MSKLKHSVVQKSYQCEFCQVKCRRPQDLRRHLFVHTEASFQCDGCGNKFTRYDTLMRHKRDNCRNSPSVWSEKNKLAKGSAQDAPKQERIESSDSRPLVDPICQAELQYQHSPPASQNRGTPIHVDSPPQFPNYQYASPAYSPMPTLLHPPPNTAPQQVPQSLPASFAPQLWPPPAPHPQLPPHHPALPVNPSAPPEMIIPPQAATPAYTQANLGQAPPPPPSQYPASLPSPGKVYLDLPTPVGTDGMPVPQYFNTNAWPTPSESGPNDPRQLPKILDENVNDPAAKKGRILQPLEPDPVKFNSDGSLTKLALPHHDGNA